MAFQTKKTVIAIEKETTEGTLVVPSAGTSFIPVLDGFDMDLAQETLENAELTGNIGTAKPFLGFETPTASLPIYVKPSGTEGQAPGYGDVAEAAFGSTASLATERDTVSSSTAGDSSTRGTIIVDSGEGAEFERGAALLIKSGADANGNYAIRNVFSVSTDTLNLGQNITNAPSSGVNLGKYVLYKPSESHPTLSVWGYIANEAALQAVAGSRVTEFGMSVAAGDFISGSVSLEGIEGFYNPIDVKATDTTIDFTDDGGTVQATVTAKTYKDPEELRSALETAMNAVATDTITVTYSNTTGKFTIASDGSSTFSLLWNSGTGAANTIGDVLGYTVSADDTGAFTYTADSVVDITAQYTVSYDDQDPLVAKNNEVLLGDFDDITCFSTRSFDFTLSNEKEDVLDVCAASGKSGSVVTKRLVTINLVADLPQYDTDKYTRFRKGTETSFTFNWGTKSGGNWVAGSCANLYLPTATITNHKIGDTGGLATLEMTLQAYVDSNSNGEVYLNFL